MSDHKRGKAIAFYTSSLPFSLPPSRERVPLRLRRIARYFSPRACGLHVHLYARCMCDRRAGGYRSMTDDGAILYSVQWPSERVSFFDARVSDAAGREEADESRRRKTGVLTFSLRTKFTTDAIRLSDVASRQRGAVARFCEYPVRAISRPAIRV